VEAVTAVSVASALEELSINADFGGVFLFDPRVGCALPVTE
jgi:hypothetical protein